MSEVSFDDSELRIEWQRRGHDYEVLVTHLPTGLTGWASDTDREAAKTTALGRIRSVLASRAPTIPLTNLHRLDLKPGDKLAVVMPDSVVSQEDAHEFTLRLQAELDEYAPDIRAVVFPPGTKLSVVSPVDEQAWKDEIQAALARWIAEQQGKHLPPMNFSR